MSDHPIQNLMTETMEKIKQMVDVNTIIGNPITTPDGTMIIPVSKVSFGFGSGGTDFVSKGAKESTPLCFGGGGGAGVTVAPICFLIVSPTTGAHILPVDAQAVTTADRLVEMLPNAFTKVSSFMESRKAAKEALAEPAAPEAAE